MRRNKAANALFLLCKKCALSTPNQYQNPHRYAKLHLWGPPSYAATIRMNRTASKLGGFGQVFSKPIHPQSRQVPCVLKTMSTLILCWSACKQVVLGSSLQLPGLTSCAWSALCVVVNPTNLKAAASWSCVSREGCSHVAVLLCFAH